MSSNDVFTCRWAILGTGFAATTFTQELYVERTEYAPAGIIHQVTAVCDESPASGTKLEDFVKNLPPAIDRASLVTCTSLDSLLKDTASSFDILYISTLNISHHDQALKALQQGKPVLVEKPACLNAEEWENLTRAAKLHNTFLMEAVWTRFLPLPTMLRQRIWEDGVIGDIKAIYSDFGIQFVNNFPDSNRVLDPKLGGGLLYDLGGYVIQTALWYMLNHPDNGGEKPANVKGSMMKYRTGVDILTNIEMEFPKLGAKAFLTASGTYNTAGIPVTRIYGTLGEIAIFSTVNCPTRAIIYSHTRTGLKFHANDFESEVELETKLPGYGYYFEADECARCIRDGIIDSPGCPQKETLMTLQIMDRVRRTNGYTLPDEMAAFQPECAS